MLVLIAISIGVYSLMEQRGINARHEALLQLDATAHEAMAIASLATQLTGAAEQYRLAPKPERIAVMEQMRGTLEETASRAPGSGGQRAGALSADARRGPVHEAGTGSPR